MAVVCDTGAVYALYDADDAQHAACKAVVESERGPLFLPVVLLAEIDYLLTSRLGADAPAPASAHHLQVTTPLTADAVQALLPFWPQGFPAHDRMQRTSELSQNADWVFDRQRLYVAVWAKMAGTARTPDAAGCSRGGWERD